MFKNLLIAVLVLAAGPGPLCAQSFDYGFKHFNTDNGLSHDNIFCITKDRQGFMWFGTMNGLNRYDGIEFKTFLHQPNDTASLLHNFITSIVCDEDGYMWVGTDGGICRYNPHKEKFQQLRFEDTADFERTYVVKNRQGRIFLLRDYRLYEVDPHKFSLKFIRRLPKVEQDYRLFIGPENTIWVMIGLGAHLYDPVKGTFEYVMGFNSERPYNTPGIMTTYTDPYGDTWIGTWEAGLYKYDHRTKECKLVSKQVAFIVSIIADPGYAKNNLLWMSAGYSGLAQLNTKTDRVIEMPKHVQQPWSHNGSRVHAFFVDTSNNILWLGTEFGLEKYDPNTEHFAKKTMPTSGSVGQFPSVNAVIKDNTDTSGRTYWISSWVGGLYKWNRQTDEMKSYSHRLYSPEVFDLQQDDDGNIWVAQWRGVQIFDPRTDKWKLVDSFIRHDTVSSKVLRLFKDSRGNMWLAPNYDGLFKYDKRTKKLLRYRLASVLDRPKNLWVSAITEDSKGNIWLAAGHHTFYISPDDKIHELKIKPHRGHPVKSNAAFSVAIDKQDNVWLANNGRLVNVTRDGNVLHVYDLQNGMKGSTLRWMLADPQGFIWIATENSLHRLNPVTGHFRYYKKEDGLFSNNITEPMTISKEGELFVGFHNAFSYTNVYNLNHRVVDVPFIFTFIQAEDRNISPIDTRSITLQPGENTLSIGFAALDYSNPEKIQYAYWMEGAEKQWHFTSQRSLTFTNLSGGNYTLHLKVMGPNGVLGREELTLGLKVIPPFYRTWWFWTLVAFGIGSILYSYYHIRQEQRARLEKIRDRIATDLHDDMGSTLSSIRIFSDVAKNQVAATQPQVVPMLEKISNNASQLSDNMQDIIWTIKQDHDKLEDLVTRIREFGLKLCDAKDISFKVHISESFKTSRLDLEQRRNLYLIFKECLNNAIKYSGCTIIQLFITQQRQHLKMVIEDNGKGFSPESVTKGNGLSNIRKRAMEINGNTTIESSPGKGTRIDVMVRLD